MRNRPAQRVTTPGAATRHADSEAGFTLIETAVSIAVAGIILAALTSFLVSVTQTTNQLNGMQSALEIATSAANETRNINGPNVPQLAQPSPVTVNGITYQLARTATACWLPPAGTTCAASNAAGSAPMYRVVITVTWPDHTCPSNTCTYSTTTLIRNNTNPQFNTNQ